MTKFMEVLLLIKGYKLLTFSWIKEGITQFGPIGS